MWRLITKKKLDMMYENLIIITTPNYPNQPRMLSLAFFAIYHFCYFSFDIDKNQCGSQSKAALKKKERNPDLEMFITPGKPSQNANFGISHLTLMKIGVECDPRQIEEK